MSMKKEFSAFRKAKNEEKFGLFVFVPMYYRGIRPSISFPVPMEFDTVIVKADRVVEIKLQDGNVYETGPEGFVVRGLKLPSGIEFSFDTKEDVELIIEAVAKLPVVKVKV